MFTVSVCFDTYHHNIFFCPFSSSFSFKPLLILFFSPLFPSFSSPLYLYLHSSCLILYFSLHALLFQRRVLRPGTAFSVHLRSWWRKSSRLQDCGRARATGEESSSPTRTQEAERAVATAPWSRQHTYTNAFTQTHVQTYMREYHTQCHTLTHKHRHKHT